jgi:hypothetical protein
VAREVDAMMTTTAMRGGAWATWILVAIGALSAGCASSQADACQPAITPGGPRPRACIHAVPPGAVVSPGDGGWTTVTVDGGVVATYPPCPCPVQR